MAFCPFARLIGVTTGLAAAFERDHEVALVVGVSPMVTA